MNTLPETFTSKKFTFKQLQREGRVALFSKTKPGWASIYYEVVVIQEHGDRVLPNGKTIPAHEGMPSSETWGTYGWSPSNLVAAKKKFGDVSAHYNAPG